MLKSTLGKKETVALESNGKRYGIKPGQIESLMKSLGPRERRILRLRRLERKKHSLRQVGSLFGVTRERVRQIENKTVRKLVTALKHATLMENLKNDQSAALDAPIDALGLSPRTENTVRIINIKTISGLAQRSAYDLLCYKNCGVKMLKEIKVRLAEVGFAMRMGDCLPLEIKDELADISVADPSTLKTL